MTGEQIKVFLLELVGKGKLDSQVVDVTIANLSESIQAALPV
jgi:hypothetical protein